MHVKVKWLAGQYRAAVQMTSPEHKGPRPVGEATGALANSRRLEDASIAALRSVLAETRVVACREAGNLLENRAERTTQDIARLPGGKMNRIERGELKAKRIELERHPSL